MSELYLMTTVVTRSRLKEFVTVLKDNKLNIGYISLGYGTASNATMNKLGLTSNEKAVIFSFVTKESWIKVKHDYTQKLYIGTPNSGIASIIPLSSIGGRRELEFLTQNQDFVRKEEETLKDTKHEMLMVITNQGYNEFVMDAAREAGARGGTVIHAQGTGMESAEKFLGISLATEKDIIMIVTKSEDKNKIMSAIMEKAGMHTKAKAIVFTLPVTDTAGLRMIED